MRFFFRLGKFLALPAIVAGCVVQKEDPMVLKVNKDDPQMLNRVLEKSPELKDYVYRPLYLIQNGN